MQRVAESCPALEDFTCHEETWDIALPFPSGFMVPLAGRLRRLKLVGWATTWQGSIGAVLLFPVLMELEVECMPANYSIRHVLEGITAPQLRRLAVESCYPYVHHASLTQYCDRFPLLQHLRYRITLYSEGFNNVAECRLFCLFCDFFRLIEVVIDEGLDGVLSTLLSALDFGIQRKSYFQDLTTILFCWDDDGDINQELVPVIRELVQNCMSPGSKYVRKVHGDDELTQDEFQWLQENVREWNEQAAEHSVGEGQILPALQSVPPACRGNSLH